MGPRVTAEHETTERADSPASGRTHPTAPRETGAGRCNTGGGTPVAWPETPWGRLRGGTGWSLRELARRSGVNAGEISKIERGIGCPTPDQAGRILKAIADHPRYEPGPG